MWLEEGPAPFFQYHSPQRGPEYEEEAELPLLDVNLEDLPELGPEVDHFSRSQLGVPKKKAGAGPLQNPQWKNTRDGLPGGPNHMTCLTGGRNWLKVPEVDDHQKLAWEVWASF